jgi:hypothetical protein
LVVGVDGCAWWVTGGLGGWVWGLVLSGVFEAVVVAAEELEVVEFGFASV